MARNLEQEMDQLRDELHELRELMSGLLLEKLHPTGFEEEISARPDDSRRVQRMERMHYIPEVAQRMAEICDTAEHRNFSGVIDYMGVFASGGRQANWIRRDVDTDRLLALAATQEVGRIISCIGNPERMKILLALLRQPMSVAELVPALGLNSTGQVYHHMKSLLAADLIAEDDAAARSGNKGVYIVRPHRVQGIIMMLAGISDMLNAELTRASWEEEPQL